MRNRLISDVQLVVIEGPHAMAWTRRTDVIPSTYLGYFQAASQAAAALLGLLFVVIVLRPGRIVGAHANPVAKGLAASTFTGLVDAFFISLLALIPGHKLGIGAAIMAVLSLYHTLHLHLGLRGARHIALFIASVLAYGLQLCLAIAFVLNPDDAGLVSDLTFTLIFAFAVALTRAWQLLQSGAVTTADEGHAATSGDGDPGAPAAASGPAASRLPASRRLRQDHQQP